MLEDYRRVLEWKEYLNEKETARTASGQGGHHLQRDSEKLQIKPLGLQLSCLWLIVNKEFLKLNSFCDDTLAIVLIKHGPGEINMIYYLFND